jgi:hypothetical protein
VALSEADGPGVIVHPLALRMGLSDDTESPSNPQGLLRTYRLDDPEAPRTAWVTYTYAILIPEYDLDIPCRVLLTRTSRPAALKINTVLHRIRDTAPPYTVAFNITTQPRSNEQGDWFVYRAATAEPTEANIEAAKVLYETIAAGFAGQQEAPAATPAKAPDTDPAI